MRSDAIAPRAQRRALVHELFEQRLGRDRERYFAALTTIAEIHARQDGTELGWRIDGGKVPAGKHIDIIVKEMK
jgi:hypothetical protein